MSSASKVNQTSGHEAVGKPNKEVPSEEHVNLETAQANNDGQKDGEVEVIYDVIETEKENTPAGGNQTEDIPVTDERENLIGGEGNSALVEGVPVQMPVEANVARVANERVTSTGSHTKEDLALLKQ